VVLYDHDFPYVFNLYADSLIALAGFAIFLLTFSTNLQLWQRVACSIVLAASWTSTAELTILVALLVLGSWLVASFVPILRTVPPRGPLLAGGLAIVVGAVIGSIHGGAFLPAKMRAPTPGQIGAVVLPEGVNKSMGLSLFSPGSYYLPVVVPGIWLDFGNFPFETMTVGAARMFDKPLYNSLVYKRYQSDAEFVGFSRLIALVETRIIDAARYLFFPLLGAGTVLAAYIGTLRIKRGTIPSEAQKEADDLGMLAIPIFASFCVVEIFLVIGNMGDAGSLYWKWGLTRVSEPGIALAMFAFLLVFTRWGCTGSKRMSCAVIGILLLTVPTWYRVYADFFLRY
jgi:hypothetical protein